jgi:hypothetical protein
MSNYTLDATYSDADRAVISDIESAFLTHYGRMPVWSEVLKWLPAMRGNRSGAWEQISIQSLQGSNGYAQQSGNIDTGVTLPMPEAQTLGVTMNGAYSGQIANWYTTLMGRSASPEEITWWEENIANGYTPEQVRGAIYNSQEAIAFRGRPVVSTPTNTPGTVNNTSNVGNAGTGQNSGSNNVLGNGFSLTSVREMLTGYGLPAQVMGMDIVTVTGLGLGAVLLWYTSQKR